MVTQASLVAVGACVLVALGWIALQIVGDLASNGVENAVFRMPSFATRRDRYPALMRIGIVWTAFSMMTGLTWVAAATSGFAEDAGDAEIFAILTAALAVLAVSFLTAWWCLAGRPRHH